VAGHIIIEWAPGRKKSAKKKRITPYGGYIRVLSKPVPQKLKRYNRHT
jgi:hypothetical protein